MVKELLAGLSLSLLVAGGALAQEAADGGKAVAAAGEVGPAPVTQAGEAEGKGAQAPVEYRIGVNGFLRGEGTGNFRLSDFGYDPGHAEGRLLYRVKPYADWHPAESIGLHLEGQLYGFAGGGRDDAKAYLYQGYLDGKLPGSGLLAVRAGRQEFSYGSNFMLGPDAFFNGLSFDAVRVRVRPADPLKIDLLGGFYAAPAADGVKGNLSGGYGSWEISEGNAVEFYALRDTGSLARHPGEELESFGARGTARIGAFSLELEPVYQSGEIFNAVTGGDDRVDAYGGHADLSAEFTLAGLKQRLSAGYAIGSGSADAARGGSARREFRNPNNDTALVGDMSVIGDLSGANVAGHHASGLRIYTLGFGVDLSKELSFSATGHYFEAAAVEAALSRDLGLETDFSLTYTLDENYSLLLGYDRFFTGPYFRGVSGSGDDLHYGYAMLQFNLERARLKAGKP